jgi:oligoribonuclease NrnB/cAMP/cGMP phosphodiesterase (DHH superfamily)
MRTIIIYHNNCPDGKCAAWIAHGHFRTPVQTQAGVFIPTDDLLFLAENYGRPFPDLDLSKLDNVYVLDFSYPRAVLLGVAAIVGKLVVLDHHKTAADDLKDLPFATFDMEKSGAMLTWEHFHGHARPPDLVSYVQDRDLWRFALPDSRAISMVTRLYLNKDFDSWTGLAAKLGREPDVVAGEGYVLLEYQKEQVEIMAKRAVLRRIGDYDVPVVNATTEFSEVGERLCEDWPEAPFAAYYLDRADGRRQWGLRGRDGGVDCSAVAKRYGGGGHPAAAGFDTGIGWFGETIPIVEDDEAAAKASAE